jgi:hypothetical protein
LLTRGRLQPVSGILVPPKMEGRGTYETP